ncbi:MAG: AAA family ATPase [Beijerinckiaceae bacterium]|nr:AAA family ATPase [Beijerinckiaceae bacterium]
MIIGPSGAGKSTLARKIGTELSLPVIHLDALNWGPDWTQREAASFRQSVAEQAAGEAWVMDGNYAETLDLRLPRVQAVIWLDLPRRVYFPRALWRSLTGIGRFRPDVGNKERFELAFFRDWVWTYPERRLRHRQLMERLPTGVQPIILTSTSEVRRFIDALPQSLGCAG